MARDDDWPAVAGNLAKARKSWGRLQGILRREGATPRISGNFFKAVVQQVLLFGAETWVVTPKMERALRPPFSRSLAVSPSSSAPSPNSPLPPASHHPPPSSPSPGM